MTLREKLIKVPAKTLVIATVSAVLIIALILGSIYLSDYLKRADADFLRPNTDEPINYSWETKTTFHTALGKYIWWTLLRWDASKNGAHPPVNAQADALLSAMSKARVSEGKVLAVSDMLFDAEVDFDVTNYLESVANDPSETRFMRDALSLIPMVTGAFSDAGLTEQEIAHTVYFIMLEGAKGEEAVSAFTKLGRDDFGTLFIGIMSITTAVQTANARGGTASDARLLSNRLYQSGADFERIFARIGQNDINIILGLTTRYTILDTTDAPVLNTSMDAICRISHFTLNTLAVAMKNLPEASINSYFRYQAGLSQNGGTGGQQSAQAEANRIIFAISLARAVNMGIKASVARGLGTTVQFAEDGSVALGGIASLNDGATQSEYKDMLSGFVEITATMTQQYASGGVPALTSLPAVGTAEYAKLSEFADYMLNVDKRLEVPMYSLIGAMASGILRGIAGGMSGTIGGK